MKTLPLRPTLVWIFLMTATAATVWLGTDHPFVSLGANLAPALALGLAFVKAHLIGQDFMEIRTAPPALRVAFSLWIGVFGVAVIALHCWS